MRSAQSCTSLTRATQSPSLGRLGLGERGRDLTIRPLSPFDDSALSGLITLNLKLKILVRAIFSRTNWQHCDQEKTIFKPPKPQGFVVL